MHASKLTGNALPDFEGKSLILILLCSGVLYGWSSVISSAACKEISKHISTLQSAFLPLKQLNFYKINITSLS